ncbi:MAG: metallophosphoesterase family protein [Halodesulfurarchaeum sp.]
MRVGVISDVHSNVVALEAVFADMPEVDRLVCAGDVVGYNPWPSECVDTVRDREVITVMGNHDRTVASGGNFGANPMAQAGVRLAQASLSEDQIQWLRGLPTERTLFDGRVRIVHGHPDDPDRYTYPEMFDSSLLGEESVLILGHTHVQHAERFDDGIVLNPGSVGQPRDGDPRAAYAVLDLESLSVDTRRVEYDVKRVVEAVREAELPETTASRLLDGR